MFALVTDRMDNQPVDETKMSMCSARDPILEDMLHFLPGYRLVIPGSTGILNTFAWSELWRLFLPEDQLVVDLPCPRARCEGQKLTPTPNPQNS